MKRALTLILMLLLCLPAPPAAAWSEPDYIPEEELPEGLAPLPGDSAFVQALDNGDGLWFILTEAPDGTRTLHVYKAFGGGYALQAQSAPLPVLNGIQPVIHAGYASVTVLYSEMLLYHFEPDFWGDWRLSAVQGEHTYRCAAYWLIEQDVWQGRFLYAENTSPLLSEFDPGSFPPDFDDAAKTLRLDGCALVNNPNPADGRTCARSRTRHPHPWASITTARPLLSWKTWATGPRCGSRARRDT